MLINDLISIDNNIYSDEYNEIGILSIRILN